MRRQSSKHKSKSTLQHSRKLLTEIKSSPLILFLSSFRKSCKQIFKNQGWRSQHLITYPIKLLNVWFGSKDPEEHLSTQNPFWCITPFRLLNWVLGLNFLCVRESVFLTTAYPSIDTDAFHLTFPSLSFSSLSAGNSMSARFSSLTLIDNLDSIFDPVPHSGFHPFIFHSERKTYFIFRPQSCHKCPKRWNQCS